MKFKFKVRHGIFIGIAAFLLIVCIAVDTVCSIYYETINTYLCGSGINFEMEGMSETLQNSDKLIRTIQEEGTVLVSNDGTLPLTKNELSKVNVFGWRSIDNGWIAGSSGSVNGNNKTNLERTTTLLKAFETNDIEWNPALTKMYEDFYNVRDGKALEVGMKYYIVSEPDASYYTPEIIAEAQEFSDIAICVIGRNGGEGTDLPLYQQVRLSDGTVETRNDRNYLELTLEEEDMIRIASENFDKTIVLIDSVYGCSYEFLDKYDVNACLYVNCGGQSGALSIPKILRGRVNPSGRLPFTVPYDFRDDPTYYNGSTIGGSSAHASYVEDIYVGYRWFETADAEGYWNSRARNIDKQLYGGSTELVNKSGYDAVVQFPFGHGLSYTEFTYEIEEYTSVDTPLSADSEISIDVTVTNNGDKKGKDVLQLYATPPYTAGGIEKSSQNLVAFVKTSMLRAGESETVTLKFALGNLMSYDCYDKNNNGFKGYELDAGDYIVSLRSNAHTVVDADNATLVYNLPENVKIDKDLVTGNTVENRFTGGTAYAGMSIDGEGSSEGKITTISRADKFAAYFPTERLANRTGSAVTAARDFVYTPVGDEAAVVMPTTGSGSPGQYLFYAKEDGSAADTSALRTGQGLVINKELMMELGNPENYDSEKWEEVLSQMSQTDIERLTKRGGYRTVEIESIGKKYCLENDGISGMNRHINVNDAINPDREQWSLFGTWTQAVCTWNTEICFLWGNAVSAEGAMSGITGWYAPSVNGNRSPFGGRCSEYGGEDPYLNGVCAARCVEGAQINGMITYVKHFAVNETETGRDGKYTWLSEQALREIYLKPFQIVVQQSHTNGIMTSMNRLGATWTGGNKALITDVLRGEWGFMGAIITDYADPTSSKGAYGWYEQGIFAGNDLWLGNGSGLGGGWDGSNATYIKYVRKACKNILYSRANAYYVSQTTNLESKLKVDTDVVVATRTVFPWWIFIVAAVNLIIIGCGVLDGILVFKPFPSQRKKYEAKLAAIAQKAAEDAEIEEAFNRKIASAGSEAKERYVRIIDALCKGYMTYRIENAVAVWYSGKTVCATFDVCDGSLVADLMLDAESDDSMRMIISSDRTEKQAVDIISLIAYKNKPKFARLRKFLSKKRTFSTVENNLNQTENAEKCEQGE